MFLVSLVVAGMDQARQLHQRVCMEVLGLQAGWISEGFPTMLTTFELVEFVFVSWSRSKAELSEEN